MKCFNCGKNMPDIASFCSNCGGKLLGVKKNVVAGAVYSIDGARGRHIDVFENKCIIKTKVTLGSFLAQNMTDGEKTIYYRDCVGVQFKNAGLTLGYLQFETSSGMMNNKNSNFFGENTFTWEPGGKNGISNQAMEEVYSYIRKRIDVIKSQGDSGATIIKESSAAEEIQKMKELLDKGIITKEEFELKKKQLLGL